MFLLSHLWAEILFDSGALHSFIVASCVRESGLKVETLENSLYVSSPLRTRVSVDMICRGCELEIYEILFTIDPRVMDMLEFDVIFGMDWLTAYRFVIDCERRRVIAYTVTPPIPVRPDWRIRTGFGVRNYILGLLFFFFLKAELISVVYK